MLCAVSASDYSGLKVSSLRFCPANRSPQRHGAKDVHPRILAHPRPSLGRETCAELIGKPLRQDLSEGVFSTLTIGKEDSSHLFSGERHHPHVLTFGHRHDPLRSEERRVGKECRSRW